MTTTFEKAKVGDRVYSPLFGKPREDGTNGTISFIAPGSLLVNGDNEYEQGFNKDGTQNDCDQLLFWRKPDFVVPEQPKRKRRVTITQRLYAHPCEGTYYITQFHDGNIHVDLGEHEFTFFVEE